MGDGVSGFCAVDGFGVDADVVGVVVSMVAMPVAVRLGSIPMIRIGVFLSRLVFGLLVCAGGVPPALAVGRAAGPLWVGRPLAAPPL